MHQGFGVAVVDDAAVVDEQQRVAHLAEFGEDVGGDEDRLALLGEDADEVLEFDPGLRVESGGGFVHDEDLRVVDAARGRGRGAGSCPWRACWRGGRRAGRGR